MIIDNKFEGDGKVYFCCKGDGKKDKLLAKGLYKGGRLVKGEYHFFDEDGKPTGDYAIGEWDEDLQMTGFGKYYFGKNSAFAGDRYEGNYNEGYMSGKGTYYWASGDRYEGEWLKDETHGFGKYYFGKKGRVCRRQI